MRAPAALLLVAALAAPAAATSPVSADRCATALTNAGIGSTTSCTTYGPPPLGNRNVGVRRTAYFAVANGAVTATLTCDGQTWTATATPAKPATLGTWGGQVCTAKAEATADGTTAAVVSTYDYVIILD